MASLLIQSKGRTSIGYDLNRVATSIGRHPENTIVLEDQSVSSHHAEIIVADDRHTLRDLQSVNGTKVNGKRMSETSLKHGDIILFGGVECRYQAQPAEEKPSPANAESVPALPSAPKEFCKRLKDSRGEVVGLWVANPENPNLKALVDSFINLEGFPANLVEAFKQGRYRTVRNKCDQNGGAFLMFGGKLAPGESNHFEYLAPVLIIAGCILSQLIFGHHSKLGPQTIWVSLTGVFTIFLGAKGFSARGIPFTTDKYITGTPARIIGITVMVIGVVFFYAFDLLFWILARDLPGFR